MATSEGKRLKPLIIEAVGYLRERGHSVKAIGEALGIAASTASLYADEAHYLKLYERAEKVVHDPDRAKRDYAAIYNREAKERAPRVKQARREFKRARKQGKPPPWHAVQERADRSPQEQAELEALVAEQERQRQIRNGGGAERPKGSQSLYTGSKSGVVFLDAPVRHEDDGTFHELVA